MITVTSKYGLKQSSVYFDDHVNAINKAIPLLRKAIKEGAQLKVILSHETKEGEVEIWEKVILLLRIEKCLNTEGRVYTIFQDYHGEESFPEFRDDFERWCDMGLEPFVEEEDSNTFSLDFEDFTDRNLCTSE
jgi:hypothetical protein